MKKTTKKGFTLVELVIVIAIIAILAAVLIPTFSGVVKKANESAVLQAARNAYTEIMADDIADGVQDAHIKNAAMDNFTAYAKGVTTVTITYTVATDGTVNFSFKDTAKKWTASFNGTTWSTTEQQ